MCAPKPCPSCGYCPACGRGGSQYPVYPIQPSNPWYPTVTWTCNEAQPLGVGTVQAVGDETV